MTRELNPRFWTHPLAACKSLLFSGPQFPYVQKEDLGQVSKGNSDFVPQPIIEEFIPL